MMSSGSYRARIRRHARPASETATAGSGAAAGKALVHGGPMFRLDFGSTRRYCDGMSRRSFLQLGVAGMASLGLPRLLQAQEESADRADSGKSNSVILIWLD